MTHLEKGLEADVSIGRSQLVTPKAKTSAPSSSQVEELDPILKGRLQTKIAVTYPASASTLLQIQDHTQAGMKSTKK